VKNTGSFRAVNVRSLLILPPGIVLASGEATEKELQPPNLQPAQSGEASWSVRAVRQDDDAVRLFRFLVRSDNADDLSCEHPLFIQGAPRRMTLRLPTDLLLRFGEKRTIPVLVESVAGNDLSDYAMELSYDPDVIAFLRVTNARSLTERGWVGAVMRTLGPGRVLISDYTTNTPLRSGTGTLVSIDAQGVFAPSGPHGAFRSSELHFRTETVVLNGGAIRSSTIDGSVYVTDDCLEPLTGASGSALQQNWPNPVSGETTISFSNANEGFVRLVVYDKIGREIKVLVNSALPRGTFSLPFNAAGMEPGVYFYRLESAAHFEAKKMLVR
jgi:hypothetical protein